jgi:hypothetical protein
LIVLTSKSLLEIAECGIRLKCSKAVFLHSQKPSPENRILTPETTELTNALVMAKPTSQTLATAVIRGGRVNQRVGIC